MASETKLYFKQHKVAQNSSQNLSIQGYTALRNVTKGYEPNWDVGSYQGALGWVGKGHSHPVWQLWEGTNHPLAAAAKKIYQLVRAKDLQKIQVFGPGSAVQVFT